MPILNVKCSTPTTIHQLQEECHSFFGWQPCRWQSEIAFKLLQKKSLVSISATGSGKSRCKRDNWVELHQNPSYECINRGPAKWALATLELICAMRVVIVEDELR